MSTKPFLLIASALAVVGGLWLTRSDQPTAQPPAVQSPFQSSSSASNLDEVDRLIGEFTTRYAEFGGVTNGTTLGRLYLIRGRITGRVDDYGAASAALASTLVEASQSTDTRLFLGYAVNGLHRFGEANMLANEILEAEPQRFDALALLGDTALSLGDYALARTSFSELDAALPGVPEVLIRQSQVAKIDGDAGRALAMASQAIESAEAAGADRPRPCLLPRGPRGTGDGARAGQHRSLIVQRGAGDRPGFPGRGGGAWGGAGSSG